MKCRKHEWKPLFAEPVEDAPQALHIRYLGLVLTLRGEYRICTACGCLGSVRRGYSRGGGHATKPISIDEERAAAIKAEAEAWNAQLTALPIR